MQEKRKDLIQTETQALILQYHNPDLTEEEKKEIETKIFLLNEPLIIYFIHKNRIKDKDEVRSCVYLGLHKAVQTYIPSETLKFSTYAIETIRQTLLQNEHKILGIAKHPNDKIHVAWKSLMLEGNFNPTREELLKRAKVTEKEYRAAGHPDSLEYMYEREEENNRELIDTIGGNTPDPIEEYANKDLRDYFLKTIGKIKDPRKQSVMIKHYFENQTLEKIAQQYGVTKQMISLLLIKARIEFAKLVQKDLVAEGENIKLPILEKEDLKFNKNEKEK